MKIIYGILTIACIGLLLTAGCTSGGKTGNTTPVQSTPASGISSPNNGADSPSVNSASTVFPDTPLSVAPGTTTLQETYADKIVGGWKTTADNKSVMYWQFDKDGNMTAGSKPGSRELTGNWSSFGFRNLFEIQAAGTNSNGSKSAYDIVIWWDIDNKTVNVQDPAEYRNWTFTRQP